MFEFQKRKSYRKSVGRECVCLRKRPGRAWALARARGDEKHFARLQQVFCITCTVTCFASRVKSYVFARLQSRLKNHVHSHILAPRVKSYVFARLQSRLLNHVHSHMLASRVKSHVFARLQSRLKNHVHSHMLASRVLSHVSKKNVCNHFLNLEFLSCIFPNR